MKKGKSISAEKLYKIFIYVVLITFAVSIIIPVAWTFIASVKQNSEFYGSPWTMPQGFHFQNYIDAFQKANMGEYFLNSIIVTVLALALLLIIAIPAAYALSRFKFKGKKILNLAFMAGLFININYIVVPIFLMLVDGNKGLKGLLEAMNIAENSWLYETFGQGFFLNNIIVLAIIYAATALPFTIYLLSSYFQTLPKAYEEAAYVDGSGYFRTMVKVMAPMAKPSIITVLLFNFLSFWNEYIIAMTLMTGDSKTLPVGLMNLMKAQNAAAQYGQMYAGLVIVMLPTLILYILVQKKLTEGMTAGGIKG
ncbi:MAG: carbohydrate ABC transporter permease [Oscillospiraceae bacterium]